MKDLKTVHVTTKSKEEDEMLPFIETVSGIRVFLDDLKPEMISIYDIAHSLSHICRFTGHTKEFYSVAQHSVLVSDCQTTLAEKRAGLLHDATEAYLNDLSSPLKTCTDLGDYGKREDMFHEVINEVFNVNDGMTPNIKKGDLRALFTEKRDLLPNSSEWGWGEDIEPFEDEIVPLSSNEAKKLFIKRFAKLFPEELVRELMNYHIKK